MERLRQYFDRPLVRAPDLFQSTARLVLPCASEDIESVQASIDQLGPINEELFEGMKKMGKIDETNAQSFDAIIEVSNDFKKHANILYDFLKEKQVDINLFELAFNQNKAQIDKAQAQIAPQAIKKTPAQNQSAILRKSQANYGEKSDLKFVFDGRYREASLSAKKSFRFGVRESIQIDNEPSQQKSVRMSLVLSDNQRRLLMFKPHDYIVKLQLSEVYRKFPVIERNDDREGLPAFRDPKNSFNLWTVFKENIGKDLSKITMPVYTKEPITMLEKFAEFIEYLPLLATANRTEDSGMRICYVAGLLYILYSNTLNRLKQPFNSLLGETYEYIKGDTKILIEQVSNHPPVLSFYGESSDFRISGDFWLKSNLSLTSFEFIAIGAFNVHLKRFSEDFVFERPATSLHNYIMGTMYFWIKGSLRCSNMVTKDHLEITFKPKGWSSKHDYEVTGKVISGDGTLKYNLTGKWNGFLMAQNARTFEQIEIVKKSPLPQNADQQYYFSRFTINLNYINIFTLHQIAPTDSRLRPDLRAYEYGDFELAALEKNRLEENQRNRRQMAKAKGVEPKPYWFEFELRDKVPTSRYKGGYFECRENNKWPSDLVDLYND